MSIKRILVLLVFLLSFVVRFWKMEYIPFTDYGDEVAYVFAGQSLVDLGTPISWSSLIDYKKEPSRQYLHYFQENEAYYNSISDYRLFHPWFDHPFLLPVIQGFWSKVFNYHFPSTPPALIIRMPMLILSSLTLIFFFLIARKIFGYWSALVSLIILGFSPTIISGQRLVVGENVYIPLMLIAIYCLINNKNNWVLIVTAFLAPLAKVPGLVVIAIGAIYYLLHKSYKNFVLFSIISFLLFLGIYLTYGFSVNRKNFTLSLFSQTQRLIGWSNPTFILSHPGFNTVTTLDASYYLILFLGLFVLLNNNYYRYKIFINSTILLLFLTLWATSAEQDMLGWYKLPLFIMLSLISGQVIKFANKGIVSILFLIVIINNFGLVRYPTHFLPNPSLLRSILAIMFLTILVFILFLKNKFKEKAQNFLVIAVLLLYITQSFYFVHKYYEAVCKDRHCYVPKITFSQLIKKYISSKPLTL